MKLLMCLFLLSVFSYTFAINVTQCHDNDKPIENLSEKVKVGNCRKPPCRLRKESVVKIELKIKPEKDVEKLTNSIFAYIVGVPFPFPGYDQTDACPFVYSPDGKNKVGCPLKAGEEYLYKNGIEVLQIYPRVKVVVHWALVDENNAYVTCFEVPARITN